MKAKNNHIMRNTFIILSLIFLLIPLTQVNTEAAMEDYCIVPPFVGATIPPLVMFVMGRDHKLYYEAYNDVFDYNDDGILDTTYNHSVDYYGYFDSYKCYAYRDGAQPYFAPISFTADKFCGVDQWSGNLMNWLTMSRMDALRKVIYGGHRDKDNTGNVEDNTTLERAYIPQDAHSWGKEFTGKLCSNGVIYSNQCITTADCDIGTQAGYTCVEDMSEKLIGIPGPTTGFSCTAYPVDQFCSMSYLPCTVDSDCPSNEECVYSSMGQVLVAKYADSNAADCSSVTDHGSLVNSYDAQNYLGHYYVTDFNDSTLIADNDHGCNDCNIFATAEFQVYPWDPMTWWFAIDGNDAVELEIDGIVVASRYGCNGQCWSGALPDATNCDTGGTPVTSQISGQVILTPGFHKIIVRHYDDANQDGVRVWYSNAGPPSYSWTPFGDSVNIVSPDIMPGNECSIRHQDFIQFGDPFAGSINSGGGTYRHLFCNTTESDGGPPLLRMHLDRQERIWQWASKEGKACDDVVLGTPTDYTVKVAVCVDGLEEENCKEYPKGNGVTKPIGLMQKYGDNPNDLVCSKNFNSCINDSNCVDPFESCVQRAEMFFGLITGSYDLHQSGGLLRWNIDHVAHAVENDNVGQLKTQGMIETFKKLKITGYDYSSSSYSACGWNTTGPPTEGDCEMWGNPIGEMIYEGLRYFAGRSDPADPDPTPDYSDDTYLSGTEGDLALPNKSDISNAKEDDEWFAPYEKFPICSKPFLLVLSDVSPSYDSDQLPGVYSKFSTGFSELPGNTLPGFNAADYTDKIGTQEGIDGGKYFIGQSGTNDDSICSEKTVSSLSTIRGLCPEEPSKQGSYYSAGAAYYGKTDFSENNQSGKRCTGTDIACASNADCADPSTCEGNPIPDVTTYSIALASPVPTLEMREEDGEAMATIVPIGVSVSDRCGGWGGIYNTTYCSDRCNPTFDADGLHLGTCTADSFCNGNQIVDFYAEAIRDDYGRFRINYEDVAEGADHDMDAIVEYEYCVGSACASPIPKNQVKVKLVSTFAAGCIDQALGFVISGTTADGTYIVVKDADTNSTSPIAPLGTSWEKTFTITGDATAKLLNDPLWYAAKYGGFRDTDNPPMTTKHCSVTVTQSCGSDADCGGETCVTETIEDPGYNKPDKVNEWDEDGDGNPDTYFFVSNPLKLEQQLERAFLDILRRASSGTAVSVLASGEERGANMLQAVFYPVKRFGDLTNSVDITWTGRMQNLWFYLDPIAQTSNVREDTGVTLGRDRILKLDDDYITKLYFDTDEGKTRAWRCHDTDGDGDCDDESPATIDFESLKNLWEAGELLFVRDPATRVIYTNISSSGLDKDDPNLDLFDMGLETRTDGNKNLTVPQLLDVANETLAQRVINFVRGVDYDGYCSTTATTVCSNTSDCPAGESCIPYRKRTATMPVKVCDNDNSQGCTIDADCASVGGECVVKTVTNTWKLGDIISSTPKIVSDIPINDYQNKYNDSEYKKFIESATYRRRGTVFTGANDGMMHAIKLGDLQRIRDYEDRTKVEALTGEMLGEEQWAFIPKHSLPYLKHLMDQGYCHFYFQDASPYLVDASIHKNTSCVESQANYHLCGKETNLDANGEIVPDETSWRTILIGSMRIGGACVSKGDALADPSKNVETPVVNVGFSTYYALDVTESLQDPSVAPKLLWEFADPNLGFSTTFPVIVRVGDPDKNGRWFAVISSGPTGPIDNGTYEFKGTSNQHLRIFILNLAGDGNGSADLMRTIDVTSLYSEIDNAFGSTSYNSAIDKEHGSSFAQSFANYQDDVVYLGYTRKETVAGKDSWTKGGILRLLTYENLEPVNWEVTQLIKNTGPITSSIVKARDESGMVERLWIYFGEGRYFYKTDDEKGTRRLHGLIDPCYSNMNYDFTLSSCHPLDPAVDYDDSKIKNATYAPYDPDNITHPVWLGLDQYLGWFIDLDCAWDTAANQCSSDFAPAPYNAERVITHPLAISFGEHALVYFTTFSPTGDLCGYGGLTYLWALDHATGGPPDPSLLQGKALIQVSTGEIKEIDLSNAFTEKKPTGETDQGRRTEGFKGVPPTGQGLSVITLPEATKRIIHMQER